MTDAELLAQFFAKGGKVQKCAPGARTTTEYEMYRAVRGRLPRRAETLDAEYIAERRMEVAREAALLGDRQFAAEVAAGMHDKALR
jgi:hypothetical protein